MELSYKMLVRASPNKEEFYHSHNTNISEAEGDFNTTAFKLTKTYLISECGKTEVATEALFLF